VPFGVIYLLKAIKGEPLFKLLLATLIHFAPFIWSKWNFKRETIVISAGLLVIYLLTMKLIGADVKEIYRSMLVEHHSDLQSYIDERLGLH
jgi:hypothetical protein